MLKIQQKINYAIIPIRMSILCQLTCGVQLSN
nr:MAG TPA: hypothetical protein [Caudoviricetes sp.]DAQ09526.1 MAG TPA: hypothetical protein [Caudoviricetes sp.]